jgi:hypothetical protein
MKTWFLFSLLLCSALLTVVSCDNGKTQDVKVVSNASLPMDIFVFIDKSQSVSYQDGAIFKKANDALTNALGLLKNPSDKISLYYLHGNTGGASATYAYTVAPFNYPKNSNTIEKNKYKKDYDFTAAREKGKVLQSFQQGLKEPNTSQTVLATDILGALEVVSRNANAGHQKYVLILTDGIQTSNGYTVSPKDIPSADADAAKTMGTIEKKYDIQKEMLAGTKAYMVLPFSPMSSGHNKYLDRYWTKVFQSYQIPLTCY